MRADSDEAFIIDLCDKVLGSQALRQHRFPFLTGDSGVCLPCDAHYPDLKLVVEYRERQHSEPVKLFDRRWTVSGMTRGEQRKRYDQRRREVLPQHGLALVELNYTMFPCNGKRLKRQAIAEIERVIRVRLRVLGHSMPSPSVTQAS
jgi:hypothetical protein